MDPRWLVPLLAALFFAAALWRGIKTGSWRGAPRTWLLLALIFAVISIWLRMAGSATT